MPRHQQPRNGDSGLAHAVGRLEGEIAALKEELARDRAEGEAENERASQHRKDLREVIGALSGAVKELTRQVTEASPLWKDYQEKRAEARGAAKLARAVYIAIAAIGGAGGAVIIEWLKNVTARGH